MTVSRSTTAKSLAWSTVENGGLALISFASLIVYLRLLSPADFGLFATALAIVELLSVIVTMLFHNALVQRPDITDLHFDTAYTATMALSVIMAIGCWAMAPAFAALVHRPDTAGVFSWMCLVFPFSAFSATLAARQRRQFEFRSLALRSLIGRLVGGGIGIAAAVLGAGVWSLVLQQILMAGIASLVLWASSDRPPRLRFGRTEFKQLIGFGLFSVGSLFLSLSIRRVYTIAASALLGIEAAGYLNLSFRVVDVFWAIAATAVSQVALPLMAGLQADPVRFKRAYQASTKFSCLALYPCFAGVGAVAPDLVQMLFGHRWLPSAPYVTVLGFLVLIQAPRLLNTPVLTALARPRDPLAGLLAELLFMLGLTWFLGMPSLAWAIAIWAAGEAVLTLGSSWMLKRATGYTWADQFRGVLQPLIASLVMAAAVIEVRAHLPPGWTPIARLTVLIPLGATVFAGVVFFLDRRLVREFLDFVQIAFARRRKANETP